MQRQYHWILVLPLLLGCDTPDARVAKLNSELTALKRELDQAKSDLAWWQSSGLGICTVMIVIGVLIGAVIGLGSQAVSYSSVREGKDMKDIALFIFRNRLECEEFDRRHPDSGSTRKRPLAYVDIHLTSAADGNIEFIDYSTNIRIAEEDICDILSNQHCYRKNSYDVGEYALSVTQFGTLLTWIKEAIAERKGRSARNQKLTEDLNAQAKELLKKDATITELKVQLLHIQEKLAAAEKEVKDFQEQTPASLHNHIQQFLAHAAKEVSDLKRRFGKDPEILQHHLSRLMTSQADQLEALYKQQSCKKGGTTNAKPKDFIWQ